MQLGLRAVIPPSLPPPPPPSIRHAINVLVNYTWLTPGLIRLQPACITLRMESVSSQSIAVCLSARDPDAVPRPRIDLADFGGEAEQEVVAESKQIMPPDVQNITPVQRPGGSRESVVSSPPSPSSHNGLRSTTNQTWTC